MVHFVGVLCVAVIVGCDSVDGFVPDREPCISLETRGYEKTQLSPGCRDSGPRNRRRFRVTVTPTGDGRLVGAGFIGLDCQGLEACLQWSPEFTDNCDDAVSVNFFAMDSATLYGLCGDDITMVGPELDLAGFGSCVDYLHLDVLEGSICP